jgi:hypothetical protein
MRIVGLLQRPNPIFVAALNLDVGPVALEPPMRPFAWRVKALNYRLYCFDGAGKVWTGDCLSAGSDAEAIELAHCMDVGVKCEIWQGNRLVATIEPQRHPRTDGDELAPGFA